MCAVCISAPHASRGIVSVELDAVGLPSDRALGNKMIQAPARYRGQKGALDLRALTGRRNARHDSVRISGTLYELLRFGPRFYSRT